VSHELRTPMNAIMGFTDIVLSSDLSDANRKALSTVVTSSHSLMQIINDILDISKIEAGKFEFNVCDFPLEQIIGLVLGNFSLLAKEKKLELKCDISSDVPKALNGDAGRLRQILVNLVGNSIKFTQKGGVYINISVESRKDESISLLFAVKDTGIGIPKEKQGVIFDAFVQGDSSTTRYYGGTGLGLAICSRLVKMMRGEIWLESEVGKGSSFYVLIPFNMPVAQLDRKEVQPKSKSAPLVPEGRKLNVLVAEDNLANQQYYQMIFEQNSCDFEIAKDGREAVDIFSKKNFDVLLMDIQMPIMNGYEVTKAIREMERKSGGRIPIVGVTAYAMKEDRQKCLDVGMDDYLSKPVNEEILLETIKKCMENVRGKQAEVS